METCKEYRELSQSEKDSIRDLKNKAEDFWGILDCWKDGREKSLAQDRLEEAVMWAVKHITE